LKGNDWVGFIISILGFLYLIFGNVFASKKQQTSNQRKKAQETFGKSDPLKDFLKKLNKEMEDLNEEEVVAPVKKYVPPSIPKKTPKQPPVPAYKSPQYKPVHHQTVAEQVTSAFAGDLHSSLDKRYGAISQEIVRDEVSRAEALIRGLSSKKDLIIVQEIMLPPLALRTPLR